MKPLTCVLLLFALFFSASCRSGKGRPSPGLIAPPDMNAEVHAQYNASMNCLKGRGLPYNNTHQTTRVTVEKVNGTQRIHGEWVFVNGGQNVGGLAYMTPRRSTRILIPVNPANQREWSRVVIRHEIGHAHDNAAEARGGHPPHLAPCYARWHSLPGRAGVLEAEDGPVYHHLHHEFDDGARMCVTVIHDGVAPLQIPGEDWFRDLRNSRLKQRK